MSAILHARLKNKNTHLNRRIFPLIVQLVYLDPKLDLPGEFGPAVGEGARLRQLLLLYLPVAAAATESR